MVVMAVCQPSLKYKQTQTISNQLRRTGIFYQIVFQLVSRKKKYVIYRLSRSGLKNILSRCQKRSSVFGLGRFLTQRQNIFYPDLPASKYHICILHQIL